MPTVPVPIDSLVLYLILVNALSFALHAICMAVARRRGLGSVGQVARGLLTLAGGAVGAQVALLLWDRHITKDNSLHYVLAVSSSVVWAVVVGFRYVVPFDRAAFAANLTDVSVVPIAYLALINLVTFVCFAVDKRRAVRGAWRVREATLLGLSLAGGALGGIGAMALLRHKIRSPQFAWGLPVTLASWLALFAFLVNAGVLS